jgi:predicted nuclease with TOPRIM domain
MTIEDLAKQIERLDKRFDKVDQRFDGIDQNFKDLKKSFDNLQDSILPITTWARTMVNERIEDSLKLVINHDSRITAIEKKLGILN